jgi:DNA-binding MarR family transcriptional regulator
MSKEDDIQVIFELLLKLQRPSVEKAWHHHGLSHAQAGMLYLLSRRQPSSVKQTADFLGVSKSAVSQLAEPLIENGLLIRLADEKDRRIARLSISAKGSKLMKQLARQKMDGLRAAIGSLDKEEINDLRRLLEKAAASQGVMNG